MAWLVLLVALALGGCAGVDGPSAETVRAARTPPTDYKGELIAYLRNFRYVSCVRFDARSTTGSYRGSRDHVAVFFGGKLEYFFELRPESRDARCRDATYEPFPELERLGRR